MGGGGGHELASSLHLLRLHSSFLTDYKKFFTQAEVTFFANIIVWFTFSYSPFHVKGFLCGFEGPNVFG